MVFKKWFQLKVKCFLRCGTFYHISVTLCRIPVVCPLSTESKYSLHCYFTIYGLMTLVIPIFMTLSLIFGYFPVFEDRSYWLV